MVRHSPTALETGIAITIGLFGLLLAANWTSVTTEMIVTGDRAADILLTQTAAHKWLLVGHYNIYGVHHPGPFFLYTRLLAQWLVGGYTATVFGAHLVGTMACSAAFAGLFTALVHRLAAKTGACGWTAACAAVAALMLVLPQISCPRELANVESNIHSGALADIWMPDVIILPFLTYMTAAVLMLRGSVFGLVAATFCAATLVHAYIPMLPIIGPVWLTGLIIGWRARLAETGHGFPPAAWFWVILIIAIFALPLILDIFINPPGNIVLILKASARIRQTNTLISAYEEFKLLSRPWRVVHLWLWPSLFAGLAITAITRRYRDSVRDTVIVTSLVIITTTLTMSQTFLPPRDHTVYFFIATALLPISFGGVLMTLELGRRRRAFALVLPVMLLPVFPMVASLHTPYRSFNEVHEMARFLAQESANSNQVEIYDSEKSATIDGLLLDIDRFGVTACYRNQAYDFVVTPERICPQPPRPGVKAYELRNEPCELRSKSNPLDGKRGAVFRSKDFKFGKDVCRYLIQKDASP